MITTLWVRLKSNLNDFFLYTKTSLQRRLHAQTLPNATPLIGKILQFTKIAVFFEPMKRFRCPSRFRKKALASVLQVVNDFFSCAIKFLIENYAHKNNYKLKKSWIYPQYIYFFLAFCIFAFKNTYFAQYLKLLCNHKNVWLHLLETLVCF